MAKKKESIYNNWDEVNSAMKQLGELTVKKEKLEGEQTIKINEIKAEYQVKADNLLIQIKEIEKNIERFADSNKEEFINNRTKKLTFGKISYRLTKSVKCLNVASAINAIKNLNLDFLLRTKSELDKDAIIKHEKDLDTKTLLKAGIYISEKDKINIEPDFVKLAALNKGE